MVRASGVFGMAFAAVLSAATAAGSLTPVNAPAYEQAQRLRLSLDLADLGVDVGDPGFGPIEIALPEGVAFVSDGAVLAPVFEERVLPRLGTVLMRELARLREVGQGRVPLRIEIHAIPAELERDMSGHLRLSRLRAEAVEAALAAALAEHATGTPVPEIASGVLIEQVSPCIPATSRRCLPENRYLIIVMESIR